MQRMWQERADYGHFFYRIPNGESAADAYDRISGFNESLWRQFSEPDFPSVCILVTHGLMTRVFLMKWYHWSVEYFEDLRNINHCEFIVMQKNAETGKYDLQNKLRTWSQLKRQRLEEAMREGQAAEPLPQDLQRRRTISQFLSHRPKLSSSPTIAQRLALPGQSPDSSPNTMHHRSEGDIALPPAAKGNDADADRAATPTDQAMSRQSDGTIDLPAGHEITPASAVPARLLSKWEAAGISAPPTPDEGEESAGSYFPNNQSTDATRARPPRKATVEDIERWASESGLGQGVKADTLGDGPSEADEIEEQVDHDVENEKAYEGSMAQSVY